MSIQKNSDIPLTDAIEQSGAVLYTSDTEKDYSRTIKEAKSGSLDAQYEVAQLLFMLGKMKNEKHAYKESLYWYDKAAKQGHDRSLFMMGYIYDKGLGVNKNPPNAFSYYKLSSEKQFPDAQLKLANMYLKGNGVAKNIELAIYWMTLSAKAGYAKAQFSLGLLYLTGEDIAKDENKALHYIESAANLNYPQAIETIRMLKNKEK